MLRKLSYPCTDGGVNSTILLDDKLTVLYALDSMVIIAVRNSTLYILDACDHIVAKTDLVPALAYSSVELVRSTGVSNSGIVETMIFCGCLCHLTDIYVVGIVCDIVAHLGETQVAGRDESHFFREEIEPMAMD